jgi:hypothetical protein
MHFSHLKGTGARWSARELDPPKAAFDFPSQSSEIKQDFLSIASFGFFCY